MRLFWRKIARDIRALHINRDVLIFLVFLAVAVAFWFLQTFKENTAMTVNFRLELTGVPKNVILTNDLPDHLAVTVSGRGFSILDYITKNESHTLQLDYSTLESDNGVITINAATLRREVAQRLSRSLKVTAISPSLVEIYYSMGDHKYVPVVPRLNVKVDAQHVYCGVKLAPSFVNIYAPEAQFDTITAIPTELCRQENLRDTTRVLLALNPPVGVKCVPDTVRATICVDLYTTKEMQLPIYCEHIPANKVLRTFPSKATVSFRVSSSLYSRIRPEDFALVVDYQTLQPNSNKCSLHMRSQPEGISNVRISPAQVDYVIEEVE